jgi:hypothetical protein
MILGNRKNIKMVNPLMRLLMPIGEFTISDEPTLAVRPSKMPAVVAAKNKAIIKNMAI